jgi:hypothetical protein
MAYCTRDSRLDWALVAAAAVTAVTALLLLMLLLTCKGRRLGRCGRQE